MLAFISKSIAQDFHVLNAKDNHFELSMSEKKVVFLNLVNTGNTYSNPSFKVDLPQGFKLLTTLPKVQELKKDELLKLFLTIQAVSSAEAGEYSFKVKFLNENLEISEIELTISLLENHDIQITPIDKPDKLSQKETEEVSFLIRNAGNVGELVSLDTYSGKVIGESKLFLKPGESQLVKTETKISQQNQSVRLVTFDLKASIPNKAQPFVSVYTVPMVKNQTTKSDPYLRLPIKAGLQYNYFTSPVENTGALFFDITGKGFIDFEGKHEIEFIAIGPNKVSLPRFGAINQYYLGYNSSKWGVELGDKVYNVSNLSETGRFSKGVKLTRKFGEGAFSAFYFVPRFYTEIKKEYGLSYYLTINEQISGTVSFLNKQQIVKDELVNSKFLNFETKFNFKSFYGLNEFSISSTSSKIALGLFHNSNLELGKIRINNNVILTGKNYFGFYRDSYQLNESINYSLNNKIHLNYSKNLMQINPSLESYVLTTAPFMNNDNFSASYRFNRYHRARITFIKSQREDKLNVQSYNYKERLWRFNYDAKFKGLYDLKIDGDIGKSLNLLESADNRIYRNQYRLRSYAGFQPFKMISTGAFMEYLNTQRFSTVTNKNKFLFYGFNASARVSKAFNVSLNYRNNFAIDELYKNQSFLDGSLTYRHGNHELNLVSSYSYLPQPYNQKNVFTSLKYTVGLNAPLRKKKGLGSVIGRIEGPKVEGVTLSLNGKEVMTSLDGSFIFNDLPPGRYYLMAQKSTIGYGNIFVDEMPYLIELKPDETKSINLEVISTGKVLGVIKFLEDTDVIKENVLIELYADNFSKLTTTDSFGRFQFSEIKEGDYQLRVVSENIKKQFKITISESNIKVIKGEESLITFEMEAKRNKIKFQSDRIILSGI